MLLVYRENNTIRFACRALVVQGSNIYFAKEIETGEPLRLEIQGSFLHFNQRVLYTSKKAFKLNQNEKIPGPGLSSNCMELVQLENVDSDSFAES